MKKFDNFQFSGKLVKGTIVPNNERYTHGHLQMYEDAEIIVYLEKKRKSKSRQQLGYLYGVVYPEISRYTGHTVNQLDSIFKTKYLKDTVMWRGAQMFTTGSKSVLSSNELAEYITNIILEAEELGIRVPEPDQAYQFK